MKITNDIPDYKNDQGSSPLPESQSSNSDLGKVSFPSTIHDAQEARESILENIALPGKEAEACSLDIKEKNCTNGLSNSESNEKTTEIGIATLNKLPDDDHKISEREAFEMMKGGDRTVPKSVHEMSVENETEQNQVNDGDEFADFDDFEGLTDEEIEQLIAEKEVKQSAFDEAEMHINLSKQQDTSELEQNKESKAIDDSSIFDNINAINNENAKIQNDKLKINMEDNKSLSKSEVHDALSETHEDKQKIKQLETFFITAKEKWEKELSSADLTPERRKKIEHELNFFNEMLHKINQGKGNEILNHEHNGVRLRDMDEEELKNALRNWRVSFNFKPLEIESTDSKTDDQKLESTKRGEPQPTGTNNKKEELLKKNEKLLSSQDRVISEFLKGKNIKEEEAKQIFESIQRIATIVYEIVIKNEIAKNELDKALEQIDTLKQLLIGHKIANLDMVVKKQIDRILIKTIDLVVKRQGSEGADDFTHIKNELVDIHTEFINAFGSNSTAGKGTAPEVHDTK